MDPSRPEFYATDHSELYDGMAVQLNSQGSGHSKAFMKIQEEAEQTYEDDEKASMLAEQAAKEEAIKNGVDPEKAAQPEPVYSQKNTSLNQEELYSGVSLVQLQDHEVDTDDVVPELNENVVIAEKKVKVEPKKVDFAGATYTEIYDE